MVFASEHFRVPTVLTGLRSASQIKPACMWAAGVDVALGALRSVSLIDGVLCSGRSRNGTYRAATTLRLLNGLYLLAVLLCLFLSVALKVESSLSLKWIRRQELDKILYRLVSRISL